MKKKFGYGAFAAIAWCASTAAQADSATTLGGIVVHSDDGNFVASLGGRIHFDYTGILPDKNSSFDSGAAKNDSGFYFRRVFVSLSGKVYGWRYRIDEDVANTSNPAAGLQDLFISHDLGEHGTIRVGQTKPFRSLDELLSNNDKIFTERNVNSATGLFGGRDYQQGLFYRYSRPEAFKSEDNFWTGVSLYSLNKTGASANQGLGYNARLAYAPVFTPRQWIHVGASFSSDHADNGAKLSAGDSVWYSYKGVRQNLVSLAGTPSSPTSAKLSSGNNPGVVTTAFELAGAFGPLYLQSEYGLAKFRLAAPAKAGVPNQQTIYAFSGEASYYLTGETKRYDTAIASYAAPRPLHDYGAVEVALGYNFIKNRNLPENDTGAVCAPTIGAIPAGSTISKCDLSYLTAGVNYYANAYVRFMLDYYYGDFDLGKAGTDRPKAVNARVQISF